MADTDRHLDGHPVDASTYTNHGCRCQGCRADHTVKHLAQSRKRAASFDTHPEGKPFSNATYRNWACRCERCRAAATASRRQYRARREAAS